MNEIPAKLLRARVIAAHLQHARTPNRQVVCLTCGNAAAALRGVGLNVAEVGDKGPVSPNKWLSAQEVARLWPGAFDATSGHLSVPVMLDIGRAVEFWLRSNPEKQIEDYQRVPSGSGETAVVLALAYPALRFTAVYDNSSAATEYNEAAPLNGMVRALCDVEMR